MQHQKRVSIFVWKVMKSGRRLWAILLEKKVEFILGYRRRNPWGKIFPNGGMEEMEDMINVGTGYFLTTPIFDLDQFEKFMKQANTFGTPVIAEVMILRTGGMAKFLNRHF